MRVIVLAYTRRDCFLVNVNESERHLAVLIQIPAKTPYLKREGGVSKEEVSRRKRIVHDPLKSSEREREGEAKGETRHTFVVYFRTAAREN